MNQIVITGKITSSLSVERAKNKNNEVVDVHVLSILGQVQGEPTQEVQIQFKAYDPAVTRMMKAAKLGDMYAVTGRLISKFEVYEDKKTGEKKTRPTFYYIYATQVEKIFK